MMKQYEDKEREVILKRECVEFVCDLCKRKAEHPCDEAFEWDRVGLGVGKLSWHYTIDGEYEPQEIDLCYDCAKAIAEAITSPTRRQSLLTVVERDANQT